MASRRIYTSSSGDAWDLVRDDGTGSILIKHQPNTASGGETTASELDVFLAKQKGKAESAALLAMIGTLVQDASKAFEKPQRMPLILPAASAPRSWLTRLLSRQR